jgi:hypothetical protein
MIAARDTAAFFPRHNDYAFTVTVSTAKPATELKDRIYFYRFNKKQIQAVKIQQ